MYLSLVYYVDVGVERLNLVRRKHDPTVGLIDPHVTVLFPVPGSMVGKGLEEHLRGIVGQKPRFPMRLCGLESSPDHWLLLTVAEGRTHFVELFQAVYSGLLAKFRRHDVGYVPHVSLGLFVQKQARYDMSASPQPADLDEARYRTALAEAEAMRFDLESTVTRLHLVELDDVVMDWARGSREDLPSDLRVRTRTHFDLPEDV